jgi:D-alanine-D-alanine ligase
MKATGKVRVAVLYGGRSAEHEVSIRSAANVIQHLDKSRYEVIPVGIDREGNWFLGQDVFEHSLEQQNVSMLPHQDSAWFVPGWIGSPSETKHQMTMKANRPHFDVVFPVVHGTLCEDGTLQGLLEVAGLPYVGCGVLASSVGMDKDVAKRLVAHAGVNVGPYVTVKKEHWQTRPAAVVQEIEQAITFPVFVKPANTGSSIGINKVKSSEQLAVALDEAFEFDTKVLIEKALNVTELEVAALESLEPDVEPIMSVVGEIKPTHEFYSYDAKYLDEHGATLLIPAASVPNEICVEAQQIARKIFLSLECEGMARVDLFYDNDSKQIYFNEINTIPGFTKISMYPKLMDASGITYSELLTHLVELALKRHHEKSKLIRSYAV